MHKRLRFRPDVLLFRLLAQRPENAWGSVAGAAVDGGRVDRPRKEGLVSSHRPLVPSRQLFEFLLVHANLALEHLQGVPLEAYLLLQHVQLHPGSESRDSGPDQATGSGPLPSS